MPMCAFSNVLLNDPSYLSWYRTHRKIHILSIVYPDDFATGAEFNFLTGLIPKTFKIGFMLLVSFMNF